jgi:transposase
MLGGLWAARIISSPSEAMVRPNHPTSCRQVLDPLGLVAGLFDARAMGDMIDHATQQNPAKRDLTVGEAVKAMVRHGLGCITQALYVVPRFFPHKPPDPLLSPRGAPAPLHDEALGRAWDTLDDSGVTARNRLIAATAAKRLDLRPTSRHLDRTSLHVAGRYTRDEPPAAPVVHSTTGDSRAHRPALTHVMVELIGEPHAGIPVLMKPRSGHSRAPHACGQGIQAHRNP